MKNFAASLLNSLSAKATLCLCVFALLAPVFTQAQLISFPKQDLVDYTAQDPFDRLPDGRPKVPNDLLERARELAIDASPRLRVATHDSLPSTCFVFQ